MGFGTETEEKDAFAILDAFVEAGGTMIDTSDVYGKGASEELIGRWRASRSSDVTNQVAIATKARFGTGPGINDIGLSRRHLDRSLNSSLRRMGVETIDLFQMHGWDALTPVEETLSFLDAAMRAGKIHYVGISYFTGWQLQLFVSTAKAMGVPLPVTQQQQYSLVYREVEYEVMPAALHNHDRSWATLDAVRAIADRIGATPSQVALGSGTSRPTAPIIGARTMEQLRDNLGSADVVLDTQAMTALAHASAPTPDDYPYGRFGVLQRKRYIDSSQQALREL